MCETFHVRKLLINTAVIGHFWLPALFCYVQMLALRALQVATQRVSTAFDWLTLELFFDFFVVGQTPQQIQPPRR
jgi:hypothetical protein